MHPCFSQKQVLLLLLLLHNLRKSLAMNGGKKIFQK